MGAFAAPKKLDGGNYCLFTAVLIPPQRSVVEPLDCVVIEHAGERGANEKFEPKNATRAEAFPYAKEQVPFD